MADSLASTPSRTSLDAFRERASQSHRQLVQRAELERKTRVIWSQCRDATRDLYTLVGNFAVARDQQKNDTLPEGAPLPETYFSRIADASRRLAEEVLKFTSVGEWRQVDREQLFQDLDLKIWGQYQPTPASRMEPDRLEERRVAFDLACDIVQRILTGDAAIDQIDAMLSDVALYWTTAYLLRILDQLWKFDPPQLDVNNPPGGDRPTPAPQAETNSPSKPVPTSTPQPVIAPTQEEATGSLHTPQAGPASQGTGSKPPAGPFEPLTSWDEIFAALNEPIGTSHWKNNKKYRYKIRQLNVRHDGPINLPEGQGKHPSVDKAALMEWWNGLKDGFDARKVEAAAEAESAHLTVAETYKHGESGTVVPGIDGSVKKTRSTRNGK